MKTGFPILILYVLMSWTCVAADGAANPTGGYATPAKLFIYNREITTFRAAIDGHSPQQRVEDLKRRMGTVPNASLFENLTYKPITVSGQEGVVFHLGSFFLFTLFEPDLDHQQGETLAQATEQVISRLTQVQDAVRAQRRPGIIFRGIGVSLSATLVYLAWIWLLKRIRNGMQQVVLRQTAGLHWLRFREIDMRRFLLQGLRRIVNALIVIGALAATYVWVGMILIQFPFTEPWGRIVGSSLKFILGNLAMKLVRGIPNLLTVVFIFFVTRWAAMLVGSLFKSLESSRTEEGLLTGDTARATRRIAVVITWIAGVVLAYPYIPGSDSEAFKGIGVLLGLMVSLGSTGVVNQLMSGFVVLYSGAIRTGEYAQVGEVEGVITDISLLSTKVLTPRNEYVTVPNAVLIGQNTINYSRQQGEERTEVSTTVTIGYDTPWRQVEAMLLQAASRTPGVRKEPQPRVLQTRLSDFYVEYELRFVPGDIRTRRATQSVLHQRILDVFNQYGVQIMSPNFVGQPEDAILVPKDDWSPPPAGEEAKNK